MTRQDERNEGEEIIICTEFFLIMYNGNNYVNT